MRSVQRARESASAMNIEELARELRKAKTALVCLGYLKALECGQLPTSWLAAQICPQALQPQTIPSHKKGFPNWMSTLESQEAPEYTSRGCCSVHPWYLHF